MPKKFKPIRVKISKNSPLENLNKIAERETCNPISAISEMTKKIKVIDEFSCKSIELIIDRNNEVKSIVYRDNAEEKSKIEPITLNVLKDAREGYSCAARDAVEKEAGGIQIESSLLKEEGSYRLSGIVKKELIDIQENSIKYCNAMTSEPDAVANRKEHEKQIKRLSQIQHNFANDSLKQITVTK